MSGMRDSRSTQNIDPVGREIREQRERAERVERQRDRALAALREVSEKVRPTAPYPRWWPAIERARDVLAELEGDR